MSTYRFEVITKTDPRDLAMAPDVLIVTGPRDDNFEEPVRKVTLTEALSLRSPVFHVGEILVINESGREVAYPGRKTSKWFVTTEVFDTIEEAAKRSEQVLSELFAQATKEV